MSWSTSWATLIISCTVLMARCVNRPITPCAVCVSPNPTSSEMNSWPRGTVVCMRGSWELRQGSVNLLVGVIGGALSRWEINRDSGIEYNGRIGPAIQENVISFWKRDIGKWRGVLTKRKSGTIYLSCLRRTSLPDSECEKEERQGNWQGECWYRLWGRAWSRCREVRWWWRRLWSVVW
jgi:hypothetical protein